MAPQRLSADEAPFWLAANLSPAICMYSPDGTADLPEASASGMAGEFGSALPPAALGGALTACQAAERKRTGRNAPPSPRIDEIL